MKKHYPVIIIGAGAAGIACGHALHEAKKDFLILEARSRVGGRVHSVRDANMSLELGAEFVHGAPPKILQWLEKLEIPFFDIQDSHHLLTQGHLKNGPEFWEDLEKFLEKLNAERKDDRSVSEFLEAHPKLSPRIRPFFKAFVEGFHAADLDLISEKGLSRTEQTDDDELNGSKMFRLQTPYIEMLEGILKNFQTSENILLESLVTEVKWGQKTGAVLKVSHNEKIEEVSCDQLVVTVPLGVLDSDQITWQPYPEQLKQTLDSLDMGHVQRIVFKFKSRFWEELSEKPLTFMHAAPENDFPTWWTFQPQRVPYLIAWQGGPRAFVLSRLSEEEKIDRAFQTLSLLTKKSKKYIKSQFETYFYHDWSLDLWESLGR